MDLQPRRRFGKRIWNLKIQPMAQASSSSAQDTSSSDDARQAGEISLRQAAETPVPSSPLQETSRPAPSTPEADLARASHRRRIGTPGRSSAVKRSAEDSPDGPSAQVFRILEDDVDHEFTNSLQKCCVVSSKKGESYI